MVGRKSCLLFTAELHDTGYVDNRTEQNRQQVAPTASAILSDGTIVEMMFQQEQRRTILAIYHAGRWTLQDAIEVGSDAGLVPFSANNNLIKK
jgi:hypothetical protein